MDDALGLVETAQTVLDNLDTLLREREAEYARMKPLVTAALAHRPNCAHTAVQRGNATCKQLGSTTPCAPCNFNMAVEAYNLGAPC